MDRKRALGLIDHKSGKAFNGYTRCSASSSKSRILLYPIEAHGLRNEEYNRLDVMRRRLKVFNRGLNNQRGDSVRTELN